MNPNDQRNVIREGRLERSEQKSDTLDFNFCKQTADFQNITNFWRENSKNSKVEVFCVNYSQCGKYKKNLSV